MCDIYAGELVAIYDDAVVFCYATDTMGVFCFYDMVFSNRFLPIFTNIKKLMPLI